MVQYQHNQHGVGSLSPGMVTKGLSEGVAADMVLYSCVLRCPGDDAEGLKAGKWCAGFPGAGKQVGIAFLIHMGSDQDLAVSGQGCFQVVVDTDAVLLTGFLLFYDDVGAHLFSLIHRIIGQMQYVIDTQGCVETHDDEGIVT